MAGPFTFPTSAAVPFDGTETVEGVVVTPPFTSENARNAIIEARDTAIGKARTSIMFQHNGTLGNNFWHGYQSTINSFDAPLVFPWNCNMSDYSFTNLKTSVDGNMEFYLNGTGSGDIIYTINFSNVNKVLTDTPNLNFNTGDLLRLRWDDNGQNPSDVCSTMFFTLT